jgi:hypothetical protein
MGLLPFVKLPRAVTVSLWIASSLLLLLLLVGGTGSGRSGDVPPQRASDIADWEEDDESLPGSRFLWSPSEQLFYDRNTGHFLEPGSRTWYDPYKDTWYRRADDDSSDDSLPRRLRKKET